MKNVTIFRLALFALATGIPAASFAQFKLQNPAGIRQVVKQSKTDAVETILEENFSKFSAGTEQAPDGTDIANKRTGEIPAEYTGMPGWTGAAVHQAGGICAIQIGKYSDGEGGSYEDTGFLRTPIGNYAGDITLTFRARLTDDGAESDNMFVLLMGTTAGVLENRNKEITKEWQDFALNFTDGDFTNCLIQISMASAKVLIDDIKVTSRQTSIIAPVTLEAADIKPDGFTARWQPTDEAESYLLSLYEKDVAGATVKEGFEGIASTGDGSMIDTANPEYPEGWDIDLSAGKDMQICKEGFNNSQALVLDEEGDKITTPYSKEPIRDFKFFVKRLTDEEGYGSRLYVDVLEGEKWWILGVIDYDRISKDGEIVSLSSKLEPNTHQVAFRFFRHEEDAGKNILIALDDISYMTDPASIPVYEDREVAGTEYAVTDLDPKKYYSYSVKAKNSEFTSRASAEQIVVSPAEPVLEEATDVTADKYTANWQISPKADGYQIKNYKVYTVPEDGDQTILEEDFSKVTSGTVEYPSGLYNSSPKLLDAYTNQPGWMGTCNYMAEGMLGAQNLFTSTGLLQTPPMDLSNNDGKFKVDITVYGGIGIDKDNMVVQAGDKIYKTFPMNGEYEKATATLEFDNGAKDLSLLLYTQSGKLFLIDDIKVYQELKKGSQIINEADNKSLIGKETNSYVFNNLSLGENEQFGYRVFAYRDYCGQMYYSLSNNMMLVKNGTSGLENIETGGCRIYVEGNVLNVMLENDATVQVNDIAGRTYVSSSKSAGRHTYSLKPGMYIVKADNKAVKVIVK